MPTPAALLLAATLLPLVAFFVLLFVGKRFGDPLAGIVGTVFVVASFVCSMLAMMAWLNVDPKTGPAWGAGVAPINLPVPWVPVGPGVNQDHPGFLDVGIYVDSLTVVMFAMVTLVSALVHLFSLGYMHHDPRFSRFFAYLSLFSFAMLGLVLGGTLVQVFVFWELVGFCSYLLIGFWFEKAPAAHAAMKAFVVNRVGDVAFLLGFGMLFYYLGNATFPHLWTTLGAAATGSGVVLPGGGGTVGPVALTLIGVGLFMGAAAKSAQFPFQVWLPDAMEGPTPVSALIHAATMVAAGVYLLGRLFPILTPDVKLLIAVVGCLTLTMGALVAIVQTDIKRVLAWSTVSQLGYMMLALGVGSWIGGLFHLVTHAFFKALLFLAAGSVIRAAHHEQEMPQFGGLILRIPVTAVTFLIAVLAISGFGVALWGFNWGFAGFYSKDLILTHAAAFSMVSADGPLLGRGAFRLLFLLPAAVAYVTPFYMMRCWMLTFAGRPRNQHLFERARETPIHFIPLIVLSVLAIFGGKSLSIRELLEQAQLETNKYCRALSGDAEFDAFATSWPTRAIGTDGSADATAPAVADPTEVVLGRAAEEAHRRTGYAWLIGLGAAALVYMNGMRAAGVLVKLPGMRAVHAYLANGLYLDELYHLLFVTPVMFLSTVARAIDRYVVDAFAGLVATATRGLSGIVARVDAEVVDGSVTGLSDLAHSLGVNLRRPQTGRIRSYVMFLLGTLSILAAAAVVTIMVMT